MSKKKTNVTDPADAPELHDAVASELAADVEIVQEDDDQLEALRAELDRAKDATLRSQADLENYRKRVARDLQEERRYAHLPLMRDLLPVLDNMDRAIEAAEQTHDATSLLEGVKMVAQQLRGVLTRHNCVEIEALGEPFDPHLHQAILQQPSDEHPAGTVLQVTQTGFLLNDRVARPAHVIVSTESPSCQEDEPQCDAGQPDQSESQDDQ